MNPSGGNSTPVADDTAPRPSRIQQLQHLEQHALHELQQLRPVIDVEASACWLEASIDWDLSR